MLHILRHLFKVVSVIIVLAMIVEPMSIALAVTSKDKGVPRSSESILSVAAEAVLDKAGNLTSPDRNGQTHFQPDPDSNLNSPVISSTVTNLQYDQFEYAGHVGGSFEALAVNGNYAYLSEGGFLSVMDISNPADPIIVNRDTLPCSIDPLPYILGITVVGNRLYLAGENSAFCIMDISDPLHPVKIGPESTEFSALDIVVQGNYAYSVHHNFFVYDLSNPASPIEIGTLQTFGDAVDLEIVGNYAYLADSNNGLLIVDITEPSRPIQTGVYTPTFAVSVDISGNYAYVVDRDHGLCIIDITNPSLPTEVSRYDVPTFVTYIYSHQVQVLGNYAYLAADDGLYMIDITNPISPTLTNSYSVDGSSIYQNRVTLNGNYAYFISYNGLHILDVAIPSHPTMLSYLDATGAVNNVEIRDNIAYLRTETGLHTVDVTSPANMNRFTHTDLSNYGASNVILSNNYAYVLGHGRYPGLHIVDITNPSQPQEVGFWNEHYAGIIGVSANHVYAFSGKDRDVHILNVSDPTHLYQTSQICSYSNFPNTDYPKVVMAGNYIYCLEDNNHSGLFELHVIDVSDPIQPQEIGSTIVNAPTAGYGTMGVGEIAIIGNSIYAAAIYKRGYLFCNGILRFDVSNATQPIGDWYYLDVGYWYVVGIGAHVYIDQGDTWYIDNTTTYTTSDLIIGYADNLLYTAGVNGDLNILDVSDPLHPQVVGNHPMPDIPLAAEAANGYVYIADNDGGLRILDVETPSSPQEVTAIYETRSLSQIGDIAVDETHAYMAPCKRFSSYSDTADDLCVANITNSETPSSANGLNLGEYSYDIHSVALSNDYAYIAGDELHSVEIIIDSIPQKLGTLAIPGKNEDMVLSGNYAYVLNNSGLSIVDITDPFNLTALGFYTTTSSSVVVTGTYAYLTGGSYNRLSILDVSNPISPTRLSFQSNFYPDLITVEKNFVFGTYGNEIIAMNILDPLQPYTSASSSVYSGNSGIYEIAVNGNQVYVAAGNGGLLVFRYTGLMPSISGYVTDSHGDPIADVEISVDEQHFAHTDANGYYRIFAPETGVFTLTVKLDDYAFFPAERRVEVLSNLEGQNFIGEAFVDPDLSFLSASPAFVTADGDQTSQVTVWLKSPHNEPVAGKHVTLFSSRGPLDIIEHTYLETSAFGTLLVAYVRSLTPGQAVFQAWVEENGLWISTPVTITFDTQEPVADEIRAQASDLVRFSNYSLDTMWIHSQAIVSENSYFRVAVGEKMFKLGADLVGNITEMWEDWSDWSNGLWASKHAFPGWKALLDSPAFASPEVCEISNTFINNIAGETDQQYQENLVRLSLRSGLYLLSAQHQNTCLGDLQQDFLLDGANIGNLLMTHLQQPTLEWPIKQEIDDARSLQGVYLDYLNTTRIPALTPAETRAYITDLKARQNALGVYTHRLEYAHNNLQSVHQANDTDQGVTEILLRQVAKGLASYSFDGPGRLLVNGVLAGFDTYMNTIALDETIQMSLLAETTLAKTAPDVIQSTSNTVVSGLNQIITGRAPTTPQGSIGNIRHYTKGRDYWGVGRQIDYAYTTLRIYNTGSQKATFYVVVDYAGWTQRFGTPWASMRMTSESTPIELPPDGSDEVHIDYKNGSQGFPPQEQGWLLQEASDIRVFLLAVNDAGVYYLDSDLSNVWDPEWIPLDKENTALQRSSQIALPVIADPLTVYAGGTAGQSYLSSYLVVHNPFTTTIPVTVTQPIATDMAPLQTGNGTLGANQITWNAWVPPLSSEIFTYTFDILAAPGVTLTLPAANLALSHPSLGILQTSAAALPFTYPWQIDISQSTPEWVTPLSSPSAVITLTNWIDASQSGSFALEIYDTTDHLVHQEVKSFNLPGLGTRTLTFSIPGTLAIGAHQFKGQIIVQESSRQAFTDYFFVGIKPPELSVSADPVASDNTIQSASDLTVIVQAMNTTNNPLTNVVISSTLPAGVSILPESIQDEGIIQNQVVRWQVNALNAGESRSFTYTIHVPNEFVNAQEEYRYLYLQAELGATETPNIHTHILSILVIQRPVFMLNLPFIIKSGNNPLPPTKTPTPTSIVTQQSTLTPTPSATLTTGPSKTTTPTVTISSTMTPTPQPSVTPPQPHSENYRLRVNVFDAGGEQSASNSYQVCSSVGQAVESALLSSANFKILGGYQAVIASGALFESFQVKYTGASPNQGNPVSTPAPAGMSTFGQVISMPPAVELYLSVIID